MARVLRVGSRGPDVARWQQFLADHDAAPGAIDGVFGKATDAATRAFQAAQGLTPDGIVGAKTYARAASLGFRSLRRLTNGELTPALIAQARRVLAEHHDEPFGSEFPFELAGVHYVARIEEHYHPPGGPLRPWGYHVGVSLLVDTVPDRTPEVLDDVTAPSTPPASLPDVAPPIRTLGVIVLDPGHGGTATVGGSSANNAKSPSNVLEKDLTLLMAERIRDRIAELAPSTRVALTRTTDDNLSLAERARVAQSLAADAFLSIHFNAFDGSARGVEAWIRSREAGNLNYTEDERFAQRLLAASYESIRAFDPGTKNRGVKQSAFGVLRDDYLGNTAAQHPCVACLLEIEFLDVEAVDALFNTGAQAESVRSSVADALARALIEELAPAP